MLTPNENETQVDYLRRCDADPDMQAQYVSYKARKSAAKQQWEDRLRGSVVTDEVDQNTQESAPTKDGTTGPEDAAALQAQPESGPDDELPPVVPPPA